MTQSQQSDSSPPSTQSISQEYLHSLPDYSRFNQSGLQLKLISEQQDQYGMSHLRYQQLYRDIPLLGAELITHIRDNSVYRVDGHLAQLGSASTNPSLNAAQAAAIATQYKKINANYSTQQQLVISATKQQYDRLAWLITIKSGLQRYIILVDALSGSIIDDIPGMPSSSFK